MRPRPQLLLAASVLISSAAVIASSPNFADGRDCRDRVCCGSNLEIVQRLLQGTAAEQRGIEQPQQAPFLLFEGGREAVAGPWQRHVQNTGDASGLRPHYHDARG